jgi:hypothetical protein
MVKKDSDGKLDMKPKFEPIEYEEELNFSLQTPTATAEEPLPSPKEKSGGSEAAQETVQESAAKIEFPPRKHSDSGSDRVATASAATATAPAISPEDDGDVEHKVTVMVHRSQETKRRSVVAAAEDESEKAAPPPVSEPEQDPPSTEDKTDSAVSPPPQAPSSRKNSHVTVIKLGSEPQENESQNTKEDHQQQPQVTFRIPAAAASKSGSGGAFPLLPPPPPSTSTKMRAGYTQILRPTPASPPAPKSSLSSSSDKSKSLPRGLPSDFSEFEQDAEMSGAQSLNPFQLEGKKEEENKRAALRQNRMDLKEAKGEEKRVVVT